MTTPHWPTDRDDFLVDERGPIRSVLNLTLIARVRAALGVHPHSGSLLVERMRQADQRTMRRKLRVG